MVPLSILQQAEQAWQSRNYGKSQSLYAQLANDPTLAKKLKRRVWKRLALSALRNRNIAQGAKALAAWTQLEPEARTTWEWNQAKGILIKNKQGQTGFEGFLAAMLQDKNLPWDTKNKAANALIQHYREQHDYIQALHVYHSIYPLAPSPVDKKALETKLQKELEALSQQNIAPAVNDSSLGTIRTFPKNILLAVYDLKRIARNDSLWAQVWQDFHTMRETGGWAQGFPFDKELTELTKRYGLPIRHIALLIPLQGPYSSIGWRIARGVSAAQWSLNQKGMELDVTIINAANPGWKQEVTSLPPTCRIIGGPLQKIIWETALKNDLQKHRAFFTFMPVLACEGKQAWRFFGSPKDQVRTIVTSAFENNISRFAILYPQEPYGRKMARYFWEEATQQGGEITAMASYVPKKPTLWAKTIAKLLKTQNLNKGELNPDPDFHAVFLPDSLENAQLIVPQFFFYNENRLMFLGPQLWGEKAKIPTPLETQYFELAVFPGAWWKDNPDISVAALKTILQNNGQKDADFWVALGYDFTRFAARMVVPSGTISSDTINKALAAPQSFDWTMAPLSWDAAGRASQHYFIFRPTGKGPRMTSNENITRRISVRETRRQAREDALNATMETTPSTVPLKSMGANATDTTDTSLPPTQTGIRRAVSNSTQTN